MFGNFDCHIATTVLQTWYFYNTVPVRETQNLKTEEKLISSYIYEKYIFLINVIIHERIVNLDQSIPNKGFKYNFIYIAII